VLSPPAHRGWCLVQAPRWGAPCAGGAVWGSQIGKIWTNNGARQGSIMATWPHREISGEGERGRKHRPEPDFSIFLFPGDKLKFNAITGAPPSAPGRGGAQSKHERQTKAARSRGFLSAIHNRRSCRRFPRATSNARRPARASFGSGWMYCASRRRWESYWNYRRWGTTK
jgi:hypothetical protein